MTLTRTKKTVLIKSIGFTITLLLTLNLCSQEFNEKAQLEKEDIFLDTLYCGEFRFISELISETEFENYKSNSKSKYYLPSATSKIVEGESEFINRINYDSILLRLKDGKLRWVVNTSDGEYGLSFVEYKFIDYLSSINHFLFIIGGWEWDSYCLIENPSTNIDKTTLLQTLSIDTVYNMVLTTRYDGFAYLGGGFKLYKIENKKLIEICELKETDSKTDDYDWAISDSYWINQNEFVYIQNYLKRNASSREKKRFMKMKIEQK